MNRRATLHASLAFAVLIGLPLARAGAEPHSGVIATAPLQVGDPYNGPTLVFSSTPDVAVIPGTRIAYIRSSNYDMFRSGRRWYYRYDGCWYQAASYNGPFKFVKAAAVPRGVQTVSARHRHEGATIRDASASRVKIRHVRRTRRYGE